MASSKQENIWKWWFTKTTRPLKQNKTKQQKTAEKVSSEEQVYNGWEEG